MLNIVQQGGVMGHIVVFVALAVSAVGGLAVWLWWLVAKKGGG